MKLLHIASQGLVVFLVIRCGNQEGESVEFHTAHFQVCFVTTVQVVRRELWHIPLPLTTIYFSRSWSISKSNVNAKFCFGHVSRECCIMEEMSSELLS